MCLRNDRHVRAERLPFHCSLEERLDGDVETAALADRGDVLELIERSTDFATFIEELVHVIDT